MANSELAAGQLLEPPRKAPVKFLRRGEGLSRFNLKENISPQREYKPGSRARQPLVDYTKPAPKPKSKEQQPAERRNRSRNSQQQPTKSKTDTAPVARKVANVTNGSSPPKNNLRRSNTLPVRKSQSLESKPQFEKPARRSATVKSKSATVVNQKLSPKKDASYPARPASSTEGSGNSMIARLSSPRKQPLSPSKQSTPANNKPPVVTARSAVGTVGRSPVDSSFYANIEKRVKNEVKENEELEVSVVREFLRY